MLTVNSISDLKVGQYLYFNNQDRLECITKITDINSLWLIEKPLYSNKPWHITYSPTCVDTVKTWIRHKITLFILDSLEEAELLSILIGIDRC